MKHAINTNIRIIRDYSVGNKKFVFCKPIPPMFQADNIRYDITMVMKSAVYSWQKVPVDLCVGWYSPAEGEEGLTEAADAIGGDSILNEVQLRILEGLPNAKEVSTDNTQTSYAQQADMGDDADSTSDSAIKPFHSVTVPDYITANDARISSGVRWVMRTREVFQITSKKCYPIPANIDADNPANVVTTFSGHWRKSGKWPKHLAGGFSWFFMIISLDEAITAAVTQAPYFLNATQEWQTALLEKYHAFFEDPHMALLDSANDDALKQLFLEYDIPADHFPQTDIRLDANILFNTRDMRDARSKTFRI